MTISNIEGKTSNTKDKHKQIEKGITEAIAKISDEDEWPEGVDAIEILALITQLARSAAHLREKTSEHKRMTIKDDSD